ncbi:MAG: hypothetical protein IPO85_12060 [Saprospiraceae bacterium]|uniref:Lipocalin-like domain-containing protein n=1 Tax=Candidatus Defluviibacterium haderslevense TaxID=2981993 RepID=A0A9D7XDQ9_9BACT|nr:hypothetical protein [Candidatus Defluviibacterium haderslevense]
MKNILALILTIILVSACEKNSDPSVIAPEKLVGSWINSSWSESNISFEKANGLKYQDYGFAFYSNHLFVERKNSGWCGTPPISYGNYVGTWIKKGSIINITVDYWGGIAEYQWELVSVDQNTLTIHVLKEVYHE